MNWAAPESVIGSSLGPAPASCQAETMPDAAATVGAGKRRGASTALSALAAVSTGNFCPYGHLGGCSGVRLKSKQSVIPSVLVVRLFNEGRLKVVSQNFTMLTCEWRFLEM